MMQHDITTNEEMCLEPIKDLSLVLIDLTLKIDATLFSIT